MIDQHVVPDVWIAAFVRASAFAATAPIVGSGAVPRIVRGGLALTIVPVLAERLPHDRGLAAWPEQAIVGAAFGVAAAMVAAAVSAAGSVIDSSMATRPFGRDSIFGGQQGPLGRLYSLAFAAIFLSSGAMTHLCSRLVDASSSAMHVMSVRGAATLVAESFEASLDIVAPAIAAQLIATLATAMAARAAPRINGLMLASPAATMAVLVVVLAGVAPAFRGLARVAWSSASTVP
ncbi:MAG TPA: flagellar biosynthetic protein FliR [Candidatus Eremiobacteraceae bacterium]|nr:flagellar biosynthetic protein FliR [Candidatus Eremiobacteraceae bacterium]